MSTRKQQLIRQHRRSKRIVMITAFAALFVVGLVFSFWWVPILLLLGWVAHEAWFADHLFYYPDEDYRYDFPPDAQQLAGTIENGYLQLCGGLPDADTLILEVKLRATLLGRFRDPRIYAGEDRQDFERGVRGRRYVNLSGQEDALLAGTLRLWGRHCRIAPNVVIYVMRNPDYVQQRTLIVAPHADDAELAAFGFYSRAREVVIVTLTQGEIEAANYRRLGLDSAAAARLKGRLRSWGSLAVPLWGGVAQQSCVQLGYYCLQLPLMAADPERPYGSRESGESDIRTVRNRNHLLLPGDTNGQPTWSNLQADLRALLIHFRPAVVVTPHPELDPHPDHVAATQAVRQAIKEGEWKPDTLLLYANHLYDNDRWPMGPAENGVALPPAIEPLPSDLLWSPLLHPEARLNKAMALAMHHDLQVPLPLKKRLRRLIQATLAGRRWPATGDDEYFRKAVRRHELFWVRKL